MYIIDNIIYRGKQEIQNNDNIYKELVKKYCKLGAKLKLGGYLKFNIYIYKNGNFIYYGDYEPEYMVGEIITGTNGITIFTKNFVYVLNEVL